VGGAALVGVLLLFIGIRMMPDRNPPLPVIGTVPDFSLVSSERETIERNDLLGHPWVVDLMFTSCAGVCPRMTTEMARLESGAGDIPEAKFVSISVDPERDTPEVLAAYAKKLGVGSERWFFLTGSQEEVHALASAGLYLPTEQGDPDQGQERGDGRDERGLATEARHGREVQPVEVGRRGRITPAEQRQQRSQRGGAKPGLPQVESRGDVGLARDLVGDQGRPTAGAGR